MRADQLTAADVGRRVSFAPAGPVELVAVEHGGPFEAPPGHPGLEPWTEAGKIPASMSVHLVVRSPRQEEPFHAWLVPGAEVEEAS